MLTFDCALADLEPLQPASVEGRFPPGARGVSEIVPTLSLILASRNDGYAGNSLWRLQTGLNFLAHEVSRIGRAKEVEAVVCDWGSDAPLRLALQLSPAAAAITRFVEVPHPLAERLAGDAPFPEVLANNAAIRRARGAYIGRIDQDTLVGGEFVTRFLRAVEGGDSAQALSEAFVFIGRRSIPESFTRRSPHFESVRAFIESYGQRLPREGRMQSPWFDAPVGIVVLHRDLWHEYRGYDERMLYWGFMETDLGLRVAERHRTLNLEREIGLHLYHLAHTRAWFRPTQRRLNPRRHPNSPVPNAEHWGLAEPELLVTAAEPSKDWEAGERLAPDEALPSVAGEWFKQGTLASARLARRAFTRDRIERDAG